VFALRSTAVEYLPLRVIGLQWGDLDPGTHPFDPVGVRGVVEDVLRRDAKEASEVAVDEERAVRLVDRALVVEYGAWAVGWCWVRSDGGPVPNQPAKRAARAMMEWRRFLEELAALFADLPAAASPNRPTVRILVAGKRTETPAPDSECDRILGMPPGATVLRPGDVDVPFQVGDWFILKSHAEAAATASRDDDSDLDSQHDVCAASKRGALTPSQIRKMIEKAQKQREKREAQ